VAHALGYDAIVTLRQVHSNRVLVITEPPLPGTEADAMVTRHPGLLLGIKTADCAPILFVDPRAGIIGATHAGWKGAAGDIVYATVLAMVGLGAEPANIRAVIGPTISGPNYEVGPDFAKAVADRHPHAALRINRPGGGREHFDLPGFIGDQLIGAGVESVADLGLCTYANPDRFFSHRYATHHGVRTGRQISAIGLI
jgi:YfiH family protein